SHRVRSGRHDSSHDGDDQNGVTEILPKEFRRDDAEERQKENQNWQFKHQSKPEQNQKDQVEVLVDGDHRLDRTNGALKTNQEPQNIRQRDEVAEGNPRDK